jgi:UDP-glucose 4-epimerase
MCIRRIVFLRGGGSHDTGIGYSVLELVRAFEEVSREIVGFEVVDRRAGDIATCWADPTYAKQRLGWQAQRSLEKMCEDTWRLQKNCPDGYSTIS